MSTKSTPAKLVVIRDTDSHQSEDAPLVVECTKARHPTLTGRVEVRWGREGREHKRWLATLRGLAVRVGDRLLMAQPSNWEEPIVIGVVDGFARRPRPSRQHAATLDLLPDEAVCIRDARGEPLMELRSGDSGAEITLTTPNASLEVDGELSIGAKRISIKAHEGEARIEASDDVVVRGESIQLN